MSIRREIVRTDRRAMSMAAWRKREAPSHLLFGGDLPRAPAVLTATQAHMLAASTLWAPEVRHGIDRAHALALVPRFVQPGEEPSAESQYLDDWMSDKVARVAADVEARVTEHIRGR